MPTLTSDHQVRVSVDLDVVMDVDFDGDRNGNLDGDRRRRQCYADRASKLFAARSTLPSPSRFTTMTTNTWMFRTTKLEAHARAEGCAALADRWVQRDVIQARGLRSFFAVTAAEQEERGETTRDERAANEDVLQHFKS